MFCSCFPQGMWSNSHIAEGFSEELKRERMMLEEDKNQQGGLLLQPDNPEVVLVNGL